MKLDNENIELRKINERYNPANNMTPQQEDNTEETLVETTHEMMQDELDEFDIAKLTIPSTIERIEDNIGEMASTILRQREILNEIEEIQQETSEGLKEIIRLTETIPRIDKEDNMEIDSNHEANIEFEKAIQEYTNINELKEVTEMTPVKLEISDSDSDATIESDETGDKDKLRKEEEIGNVIQEIKDTSDKPLTVNEQVKWKRNFTKRITKIF